MKEHNWEVRQTRVAQLGYVKLGVSQWKYVDLQGRTVEQLPITVGFTYRTKAELLADLDRYAKEWGY